MFKFLIGLLLAIHVCLGSCGSWKCVVRLGDRAFLFVRKFEGGVREKPPNLDDEVDRLHWYAKVGLPTAILDNTKYKVLEFSEQELWIIGVHVDDNGEAWIENCKLQKPWRGYVLKWLDGVELKESNIYGKPVEKFRYRWKDQFIFAYPWENSWKENMYRDVVLIRSYLSGDNIMNDLQFILTNSGHLVVIDPWTGSSGWVDINNQVHVDRLQEMADFLKYKPISNLNNWLDQEQKVGPSDSCVVKKGDCSKYGPWWALWWPVNEDERVKVLYEPPYGMPCNSFSERDPSASWVGSSLKIDFKWSADDTETFSDIQMQEEGHCHDILDGMDDEKKHSLPHLDHGVYPKSWGVCFKSTMRYQKIYRPPADEWTSEERAKAEKQERKNPRIVRREIVEEEVYVLLI